MEKRTRVSTFEITISCDKCNEGTLNHTGARFIVGIKTYYPHKCNKCGELTDLEKIYPYYEYEEYKEPMYVKVSNDYKPVKVIKGI